jgi:glyoxylase-like metal-dependent hydrolase (beta-lactamase superfamily II)
MPASVCRSLKALAELGAEPVTHLVNTHWHFDHADGNEWLHSAGAEIIAQENTRKHLSEIQRVEDWDNNFLPLRSGGIPSEVFAGEHRLKLNGSSIGLKYYGPAHTDSDISVTFAEANIVHVGDTYWNGIYPFIDYSTGGSIDGMIAASDANLAATTNDTIIIPGHGRPVSNKASLKNSATCSSLSRRTLQSSRSKEGHATRPSRRNQPPPSMPNGANLSSIPGTSPGWSMKASDRGPSQQR